MNKSQLLEKDLNCDLSSVIDKMQKERYRRHKFRDYLLEIRELIGNTVGMSQAGRIKMEISDVLRLAIREIKMSKSLAQTESYQKGISTCENEAINFLHFNENASTNLNGQLIRNIGESLEKSRKILNCEIDKDQQFHYQSTALLDLTQKSTNVMASENYPTNLKQIDQLSAAERMCNRNDNEINENNLGYTRDVGRSEVLQKIRQKIFEKRKTSRRRQHLVVANGQFQTNDEFMWRPW